ncbi:uncharacterized protein [Dermacentor andersoni]|uniref:uncharacterized protein n=1 Tax=Dermacentor andersoni TaxID=34620 RepID=UPI003B3AD374
MDCCQDDIGCYGLPKMHLADLLWQLLQVVCTLWRYGGFLVIKLLSAVREGRSSTVELKSSHLQIAVKISKPHCICMVWNSKNSAETVVEQPAISSSNSPTLPVLWPSPWSIEAFQLSSCNYEK